jgi:two-component system response regulator MprA
VLLVDDDPAVREGLRRVLVSQPLHVIAAATGAEAMRLLDEQDPDLLITDLCMARVSGWDLIEHEAHYRPDLPIFIITALPAKDSRHADQLATAFFQKPLDLEALLAAIRHQLCTEDSEKALSKESLL